MRSSTAALVLVLAATACTRYVVRAESDPAGAQILVNGDTSRQGRWSVAPDHPTIVQARWPDGKTVGATLLLDQDSAIVLRRDGAPDHVSGARLFAAPSPVEQVTPPPAGPGDPPVVVKPGPEDPMARARKLYDEGQKAYELTDYDVAIEKFKAAYELIRSSNDPAAPEILGNVIFNLAVVYERSYEVTPDPERLRRARVMYRQYDEQMTAIVPNWASSGEHADVLGRIRALEARLGPSK